MNYKLLIFIVLYVIAGNSIAEDCQLPKSLSKSQILFMINEIYTPSNPDAGGIQQLSFTEKNIIAIELTKGIRGQGTYQYRIIATGVGLIDVKLSQGDEAAIFRMVLMCENDYSGKYIFSQSQGVMKPDRRQDTGDYIIENTVNR